MKFQEDAIKRTVLVFVFNGDDLLMIKKKRGQGAGKINVPGGKIQPGESEEDAAKRETLEETGISPGKLSLAGKLEFYFQDGSSWDNVCSVFVTNESTGELLKESTECNAFWVNSGEIPLEKMWASDRLWLPLLKNRKPFHRIYVFDHNDQVIEEKIIK